MEEYEGSVNRAFSQYHDEFVTGCEFQNRAIRFTGNLRHGSCR